MIRSLHEQGALDSLANVIGRVRNLRNPHRKFLPDELAIEILKGYHPGHVRLLVHEAGSKEALKEAAVPAVSKKHHEVQQRCGAVRVLYHPDAPAGCTRVHVLSLATHLCLRHQGHTTQCHVNVPPRTSMPGIASSVRFRQPTAICWRGALIWTTRTCPRHI